MGRAQLMRRGLDDFRYATYALDGHHMDGLYGATPATGRIEAFGAQPRGSFDYTQKPGQSRWNGGSVGGGLVFLPPKLDLEAAIGDQWDGLISRYDISKSIFIMGPNTSLGFGKPDLDSGGVKDGLELSMEDDGDTLYITTPTHGKRELFPTADYPPGEGLILESGGGFRFRVGVNDSGDLTTTAL